MVLECFFLPRGLGSRRDFARKKGEKGLLLVGHEKVPHGFGFTGDCSSHPADGAGTSTSFPETRYPGLDTGRGKDCASVGILEDFNILLRTLGHYSKSV